MDTVKRVPPDNKISIVDPPKSAPTAYPISTFTYIILPLKSDNAAALRKFVFWGMTNGARSSGRRSVSYRFRRRFSAPRRRR